MRSENELAGVNGPDSQDFDQNNACAAPACVLPVIPPFEILCDASRRGVMDARWRAFCETVMHTPKKVRARLLAAATRTVLNNAKVQLARVRWQARNFELDDAGTWAIIAPIYEGDEIVDLAAFDMDNVDMRRTYWLGQFAVGFDPALWEANRHPRGRMLIHYDVWSWLRADCLGCLPIDWKRTAVALLESRVSALVYPDEMQARQSEPRIRCALKPPPSFVKRAAA